MTLRQSELLFVPSGLRAGMGFSLGFEISNRLVEPCLESLELSPKPTALQGRPRNITADTTMSKVQLKVLLPSVCRACMWAWYFALSGAKASFTNDSQLVVCTCPVLR